MNTTNTERIGVARCEIKFNEYGWIFREQQVQDKGIDAQLEIIDTSNLEPSYRLVALQIKSGESYFKEKSENSIIFRTDEKHIDYWMRYPLPVVIVLYSPVDNKIYWQLVSRENISRTEKGNYKISIPISNTFDETPPPSFHKIWQPSAETAKWERLRFSRSLIESLQKSSNHMSLMLTKTANKSLVRYNGKLTVKNKSGKTLKEKELSAYAGKYPIERFLQDTFPWAEFSGNEEAYRDHLKPAWAADHIHHGPEGEYYESESFDDWYKRQAKKPLLPVTDGEFITYDLTLKLNKLGKAFLTVDDYLKGGE
ncbi:MAG: DUF4365 domain-containing protein [Lautropia sp.]|nr:DUF4365 domain-containing protein [Lautropia sp.]